MTDNEIIKALECCITADSIADCMKLKCPMHTRYGCTYYLNTGDDGEHTICREQFKSALDLINRKDKRIAELQAENERLKAEIRNTDNFLNSLDRPLVEVKSEAIKEFAERVCEDRVSNDPVVIAVKTELKLMEGKTK